MAISKKNSCGNPILAIVLALIVRFAGFLTNFGAPGRTRTCDPRLRRAMLYPLSYGRVRRRLHSVWRDSTRGNSDHWPTHCIRDRAEMIRLRALAGVAIIASFGLAGCHPGAVVDTSPKPSVGGTIAGVVRSGANPVIGRKVTAINVASGARFDASTGVNGGYTIQVPEGTYRLDIEVLAGESIAKR